MARKVLSGILIALSAIFFVASLIGIGTIWYYRGPLTRQVTGQLKDIDAQLAQAEATLDSSEKELQRALRIVDAAQAAMDKFKSQTNSAANFFDTIQSTLNDKLLPDLKTTRGQISTARSTLENLQSLLNGVSGFIPGVDLTLPNKALSDLIMSARSLDSDIANAETLATQASTFVGDTGYLLGGDLTETRNSLQNFLSSIGDYKQRLAHWRQQDQQLLQGAPKWINEASIILTVFLLWFAFSQLALLLYGVSMQRGVDPFLALRKQQMIEATTTEEDIDLELEA